MFKGLKNINTRRFTHLYCVINVDAMKALIFNGDVIDISIPPLTEKEELFYLNPNDLIESRCKVFVLEYLKTLNYLEKVFYVDKENKFITPYYILYKDNYCFYYTSTPNSGLINTRYFIGGNYPENFYKEESEEYKKLKKNLLNIKNL